MFQAPPTSEMITQCGVQGKKDSVQLVQITPISLWFMVLITNYLLGFIKKFITFGGPTSQVCGNPTAPHEFLIGKGGGIH